MFFKAKAIMCHELMIIVLWKILSGNAGKIKKIHYQELYN